MVRKGSYQLLSRMKLAQHFRHFASKLTKLCNTLFNKALFFEASPSSLGWKSNFERLLAVKRYPQPGSFRELKAIEKTIPKVQRAFAKKCCYWYAYIATESLKLSSHNGKTWKGIVAGIWITSSPTVPSSLLGMLQVTFPCFREIWNLVEFSSTAQEKCMMHFSLQE